MQGSRSFLLPVVGLLAVFALAQDAGFHHAPASAAQTKNPLAGQNAAVEAGKKLYGAKCATCHGADGEGTGNVPSLKNGPAQIAKDGEIYWFITKGDPSHGMPAWASLPKSQRWQLVSYIKALKTAGPATVETASQATPSSSKSGNVYGPFYDFHGEKPGTMHHITVAELPKPYATESSSNGPHIVPRPQNAWPQTLPGFKVELFAGNLENPREIRTAPNGDIFVAEMKAGKILIFRGMTADGKPQQSSTFMTDLDGPFGIAFYPPGPNPQWIYIGDTNELLRVPYQNGDLQARGQKQHLLDLPTGGHSTRNVRFSPDGKHMFLAVGSHSNVDDPDTHPEEHDRANILEANPDGSDLHVYASGIRNPVGLAIDPKTGELWCSVNERDALGDNLVPDYITHVQEGGFYGWPWYYMGDHHDPRLPEKPELGNKVITPDVLLQPHSASLGMTFYEGKMFPKEYDGDIFAAEHGSWNRSVRVGYELIRVPLHQTGKASGQYEDFVTGFVTPDGNAWGRPVGVTVAPDGSLLFTDDGSNSIWRVTTK